MKTLEKLKELIKKEGFEYHITDLSKDQVIMIIQEKDPWEGVEFVDRKTTEWPICKISRFDNQGVYYFNSDGKEMFWSKEGLEPSTESAYIEQLKKTAYEKFGEIKEGDRFDLTPISICFSNHVKIRKTIFEYDKIEDSFSVDDFIIYQQGKWATKLPERVKVEFDTSRGFTLNDDQTHWKYKFEFFVKNNPKRNLHYCGEHLAKQLENYLNNEKQD